MNRQQDAVGKAAHHQVLTCLPPWMDNLSFAARWEGIAAATLLPLLPCLALLPSTPQYIPPSIASHHLSTWQYLSFHCRSCSQAFWLNALMIACAECKNGLQVVAGTVRLLCCHCAQPHSIAVVVVCLTPALVELYGMHLQTDLSLEPLTFDIVNKLEACRQLE